MPKNSSKYALYLAVLPAYRQACISMLDERFGDSISYFSGDAHLVSTVRTGISSDNLKLVSNRAFFGRRLLLQTGHIIDAMRTESLITDLNPRSITAWALILTRRVLNRRTIVWGHLHPRSGPTARTAPLRRAMRRFANGYISYDYRSAKELVGAKPAADLWVAPNALYYAKDIAASRNVARTDILYVGRLVADKKVDLLIRAYAKSSLPTRGIKLKIFGAGPELSRLNRLAEATPVGHMIEFPGEIYDPAALSSAYAQAVATVNPGYAGLLITQSLGFGVPILIPADELHAPEIELESTGAVSYFDKDSIASLSDALDRVHDVEDELREELSLHVRTNYSAEKMSDGIARALLNLTSNGVRS